MNLGSAIAAHGWRAPAVVVTRADVQLPGWSVLILIALVIAFIVVVSKAKSRQLEARIRAVEAAAVEAARNDHAFAVDRVRADAERLFRDTFEAWEARDRDRLGELMTPDAAAKFARGMERHHIHVSVESVSSVRLVRLINRSEDRGDRVTAYIAAQTRIREQIPGVKRTGSRRAGCLGGILGGSGPWPSETGAGSSTRSRIATPWTGTVVSGSRSSRGRVRRATPEPSGPGVDCRFAGACPAGRRPELLFGDQRSHAVGLIGGRGRPDLARLGRTRGPARISVLGSRVVGHRQRGLLARRDLGCGAHPEQAVQSVLRLALNNNVKLSVRRAYGFHSADAALALVHLTCGPATLIVPHEQAFA